MTRDEPRKHIRTIHGIWLHKLFKILKKKTLFKRNVAIYKIK